MNQKRQYKRSGIQFYFNPLALRLYKEKSSAPGKLIDSVLALARVFDESGIDFEDALRTEKTEGTSVVPEFQSFLVFSLVVLTDGVAIVALRRAHALTAGVAMTVGAAVVALRRRKFAPALSG